MQKFAALLSVLAFAISVGGAQAQSPDLVAKGEYLARAGDCVVCHTGPGEKPFAGGLKMAIPIINGVIYSTNITPDKETGIGNYTFEDFERAMRRGVAKDGHNLYPAMPYPSYAKVSEDDLRALYAFFMQSVPAVKRANQPSEIKPPLNMRWPLMFWNLIFNPSSGFEADSKHDAAWNRGAYLVQGLGHCGSCHTPRGIVFQEKAMTESGAAFLSGAELDLWSASNLTGDQAAGLGRWSESDLATFLKTGHNAHASAFGSMTDVINNSTQYMTDADLTAIAKYIKSLPPANASTQASYAYDSKSADALKAGTSLSSGAKTYIRQCAACHVTDGKGHAPYLPPLAGNPTVLDKDPSSLINITLNGSARIVVQGLPDAYRMPQFRVLSNDQDVADVVNFIRTSWGNNAPAVTVEQVAKIRANTDPASDAVVILKMR